MSSLLWKVNLPAGRIASVSDLGTYVVASEDGKRWTVEFTAFPTDTAMHPGIPAPRRIFASWEKACLACAQHAEVCNEQAILVSR